jgi:hypothetical protein
MSWSHSPTSAMSRPATRPDGPGFPARTRRCFHANAAGDEALPTVAIANDASVMCTNERIAPDDRVGAVLRHARTQH